MIGNSVAAVREMDGSTLGDGVGFGVAVVVVTAAVAGAVGQGTDGDGSRPWDGVASPERSASQMPATMPIRAAWCMFR